MSDCRGSVGSSLCTGGGLCLQKCWLHVPFGTLEESHSVGTLHIVKVNETGVVLL